VDGSSMLSGQASASSPTSAASVASIESIRPTRLCESRCKTVSWSAIPCTAPVVMSRDRFRVGPPPLPSRRSSRISLPSRRPSARC
jgi:hypothetical protein